MLLSANAFEVEDGTGLANATSYVSDTDATNYVANTLRGLQNNVFKNAVVADKQKYLNFATLFFR